MSAVITGLIVLFTVITLTAALMFLFTLPTIVRGWRQRREDEYALAELRTAKLKAQRHRNHP
jgi:hypothetical protein